MRKRVLGIILFLSLIIENCQSGQICLAADTIDYYQIGNATTVKTLDETLNLLEDNSPSIKQLKLQYDTKAYEWKAAKDVLDDCQELYVVNVGDCDADTLESVREQYLSALLNYEQLSFYSKNKIGLMAYDLKKQKYELLSMYYQMLVLFKQEAYYLENKKYLSVCKSIADVKYRYGKCTALEVSQVSEQIEENDSALYEAESEQEKLSAKLEDTMGIPVNFAVKVPLPTAVKNYVLEDTVVLINQNEYSYEEAISNRDAYDICNTCEKAVNGSITYNKNSLLVQQYSLKAEEIKKNIISYAKSLIAEYKKAGKKLSVASKKLKNSETSYHNFMQKYKKGKAAKVEVLEANRKKAEAEYNYYSIVSKQIIQAYKLDNGIYLTDVG